MKALPWSAAACGAAVVLLAGCAGAPAVPDLPAGVAVDYQLGGDYEPADDVRVVVRDWYAGVPLERDDAYSLCYVNAFQTQADDPGADRPDEDRAWPAGLVLAGLEDPGWPGEHLIDLGTEDSREAAAEHLAQMVDTCADKGFDAVELDNLDSWTRFDDRPEVVPFGEQDALAYAGLLADLAHDRGLAVAQKNTPGLSAQQVADVGFDLAVVEECGRYDECDAYAAVHGDRLLVVEYTDEGLARACEALGDRVAVVLRDAGLSVPGSPGYRAERC
ncbi:endo alpha-1,4 polygalactosaminidase [Jannaschia sp. R86511]|uniref:endo alpha-1,4 polygalactosaminidase n=1 Tax=Jannaschia sp. R86511 TaxID=3093853 RepID=UPI0036D2F02B